MNSDTTSIKWIHYTLIAQHTFFSNAHKTFTKLDHILGHKTHFNKFKRIEIIQSMLSDHNGIKVEISNKKIAGKSPNTIFED